MKLFRWTALLLGVALPAVAQNQPAKYQYILTVQVKPGTAQQYEDYVKKIVEAAKKNGDAQNWAAFNVTVGGPGGQYGFVLPFNTWAEQDSWTSPREMLVKAFGEEEAAKITRSGVAAMESSEATISQFQSDLSSKEAGAGGIKNSYVVSRTTIKPEKVQDYRLAISKIRAAYDKAGGAPSTVRRTIRGNRWTFSSATGYDSGAERDKEPEFGATMSAMYSDREIEQIMDMLRGATAESTWFEVVYRPDLSHPPAASTND